MKGFLSIFFTFSVFCLVNLTASTPNLSPTDSNIRAGRSFAANDLVNISFSNDTPSESNPYAECPEEEDISPCICEKYCEDCQAVIHCFNITNLDQLSHVFQKSGDFPFRTASFYNMTILYFPAYSFIAKQYRLLHIHNSTQVSLFDEPPASNSLLQSLTLESLHLQRSIQWELFSAFRELTSIEIRDITLGKIRNSVGQVLPQKLTKLDLQNTRTTSLEDNAFAPLKNLGYIGVTENQITIVKRSMFPRPFIGTMISLNDNKIESLPDDFLKDMPLMTGLDLENNSITTVSESVFGRLPPNLRAIFFKGNPIVCDCNMKWISQRPMIYLGGQCASPASNKDKYLSTLKPNDFSYC